MTLPLLYHFSYLFKLQITSLLRPNVFESLVEPKQYLWVLQLSYTNFFISESTTHSVVFFYFRCHLFREKMWIKGFSTESDQICVENLCLKTRSFYFTVGKEIINSSEGENDGESMGMPLKCTRSDTSGSQKFRLSEWSWGHQYPQPWQASQGRRACASVACLSAELEPLSPAGSTHLP